MKVVGGIEEVVKKSNPKFKIDCATVLAPNLNYLPSAFLKNFKKSQYFRLWHTSPQTRCFLRLCAVVSHCMAILLESTPMKFSFSVIALHRL